jgi:hypothetical protein
VRRLHRAPSECSSISSKELIKLLAFDELLIEAESGK